jgi:hypothetical protein
MSNFKTTLKKQKVDMTMQPVMVTRAQHSKNMMRSGAGEDTFDMFS